MFPRSYRSDLRPHVSGRLHQLLSELGGELPYTEDTLEHRNEQSGTSVRGLLIVWAGGPAGVIHPARALNVPHSLAAEGLTSLRWNRVHGFHHRCLYVRCIGRSHRQWVVSTLITHDDGDAVRVRSVPGTLFPPPYGQDPITCVTVAAGAYIDAVRTATIKPVSLVEVVLRSVLLYAFISTSQAFICSLFGHVPAPFALGDYE